MTSGRILIIVVVALSIAVAVFVWQGYEPQRFAPIAVDAPLDCVVEMAAETIRIENHNDFSYDRIELVLRPQRSSDDFSRSVVGPDPGQVLTIGLLTLTDISGRSMNRERFGVAELELRIQTQDHTLIWKGRPIQS